MSFIPWDQINAVLLEGGSAETRVELYDRLLAGIGGIIPWDVGAGVFDREIKCVSCLGWDRRTFEHYNGHYYAKVPFILYNEAGVAYRGKDVVQWSRVSDCEFTRDFARPLGLHSGLSPFRPAWAFNISIQRSKDFPSFTSRDCEILDVFNAHMHNYLRFLNRIENLTGGTPDGASTVAPSSAAREAFRRSFALSEREMEVLEGLCEGLLNRSLAANLCISERTVKAHLSSIFGKTGAMTRTGVVALSCRVFRG